MSRAAVLSSRSSGRVGRGVDRGTVDEHAQQRNRRTRSVSASGGVHARAGRGHPRALGRRCWGQDVAEVFRLSCDESDAQRTWSGSPPGSKGPPFTCAHETPSAPTTTWSIPLQVDWCRDRSSFRHRTQALSRAQIERTNRFGVLAIVRVVLLAHQRGVHAAEIASGYSVASSIELNVEPSSNRSRPSANKHPIAAVFGRPPPPGPGLTFVVTTPTAERRDHLRSGRGHACWVARQQLPVDRDPRNHPAQPIAFAHPTTRPPEPCAADKSNAISMRQLRERRGRPPDRRTPRRSARPADSVIQPPRTIANRVPPGGHEGSRPRPIDRRRPGTPTHTAPGYDRAHPTPTTRRRTPRRTRQLPAPP